MLRLIVVAVAALLTSAETSRAELVFFASGRALSVQAIRSQGDQLVLKLRSGGEIVCSPALITRVEPDEVEYPDQAFDAAATDRRALESPAVPARYRNLIASAAAKHGLNAELVHAVIQVESAYQSRAVSPKGARGLMQLMPSTGRQYGALDLFDPEVNIDAGVRHLKGLLKRFELPLALAAYNAGEGAVQRFRGIPPFRETRSYVSKILQILDRS